MRYLVYGYYGHHNFGDDLLLRGVIEGICARDTDARFLIHSRDPVHEYEGDARVRFTGLARHLEGVRSRPWRALEYLIAFARCIERSDVIVIGGGTLFIDKGRLNLSLVLLLLAAWYARFRGRKIVILGVAIDSLTNPVSRWATARIFALADFVAVRDDVSLKFLAHIPSDRRHRAGDLVFGLTLEPPLESHRGRPVIGLCFIDYFGTVERSDRDRVAYERAILNIIDVNRDRYDFASIVLQRGVGQRDDWLEATLLRMRPAVAIHDVASFDAARDTLGKVDAVLTTRYHLGVLALLWDKPVIIVDHELKMRSLAQDFGLPAVPLADFVAHGIPDLANLLAGIDRRRIVEARDREQARARLNFTWMQ